MLKFVKVSEFEKDFISLKKKYGGIIEEDLERFKKVLLVDPTKVSGTVKIPNLGKNIHPVYKARKFRCKALNKGSQSGIRVIYTHNPEIGEIILIEIYYKGKKENHDHQRAMKYVIKIS